MENNYQLLENKLKELEALDQRILPSLNQFLQDNNLYMTYEDKKALKKIIVKNKKWKMQFVGDWQIVRRGRKNNE